MENENTSLNVNLPNYSIPGILQYIQSEWSKFELERAQWQVEKAELEARIAYLQGEQAGQANLKRDLVRRIKMLEFALKQERQKITNDNIQNSDGHSEDSDSDVEEENNTDQPGRTEFYWNHGRQLLRQYLTEVGYSDTIINVRATRLNELLEGKNRNHKNKTTDGTKIMEKETVLPTDKNEELNFVYSEQTMRRKDPWEGAVSDESLQEKINQYQKETLSSMQEKFKKQMENGDDDNDDVNDDAKGDHWWQSGLGKGNNHILQNSGSFTNGKGDELNSIKVGNDLIDGIGNSGVQLGNRFHEHSLNLTSQNDMFGSSTDDMGFSNTGYDLMSEELNNTSNQFTPRFNLRGHFGNVRDLCFHPTETIAFSCSDDGTMKLWSMIAKDEPGKKVAEVEPVYSFRTHKTSLLSCAVTHAGYQAKTPENGSRDANMATSCFSGSADGKIFCYNAPSVQIPEVALMNYVPETVINCELEGHSDAVWSLAWSKENEVLASSSADGTVQIWNPKHCVDSDKYEMSPKFENKKEDDWTDLDDSSIDCQDFETWMRYPVVKSIAKFLPENSGTEINNLYLCPTKLEWMDRSKLIVCFTNGSIKVYDPEYNKVTAEINAEFQLLHNLSHLESQDFQTRDSINAVSVNRQLQLIAAAYEDNYVRVFDIRSGQMTSSFVAHQDAVTSISLDPDAINLATGSTTGNLRIWNLTSKNCIQDINAHSSYQDESISVVKFHPSKPKMLASAGVDSTVKVFYSY